MKPPWLSLAEVGSGQFPAVFIDDSGSPGHPTTSPYLHPQRKTWAAVIMAADQVASTHAILPQALAGLRKHVGAAEFHFADLLSGKGLRRVPFDVRLQAFRLMAEVFAIQRYPVIVQTISPDNVREHEDVLSRMPSVGPFRPTDPADISLLFLLARVGMFVRGYPTDFVGPPLVFVDEGRFRAGTAITLRPLLDFAAYQSLFFRSSSDLPFLQFADFAAFSINRMQWLMAKPVRTAKDESLLRILLKAGLEVINLEAREIDLSSWKAVDYDEWHIRDRLAKGLDPIPGKRLK